MIRLFFALLLLLSFSGCWDSANDSASKETNQTETTLHDDSSMPKPIIEDEPAEEPEPIVEQEENLSIANAPLEVVAVQSVGATKQESVEATVQATPFSDVYVNDVKVAVTDAQGHALVTLNTSGTVGNKRFTIHVENKSGLRSKKYALVIRKEEAATANQPPKLVSLAFAKSSLQLVKGQTAQLTVLGRYENGKSQDFTRNVTWHVGDSTIASVSGNTLTALASGTTTLRASYSSVRSNALSITVNDKEVVNGYTLPPEPDPVVNDATLLGVDSNNNGVRDDVERWAILKYKDEHKIVTEIALQAGRASQIVIQDPSKAYETVKYMQAVVDCESYYQYAHKPRIVKHAIANRTFDAVQFNTKERIQAYMQYNAALSGGVFNSRKISEWKNSCDFDDDALLKE